MPHKHIESTFPGDCWSQVRVYSSEIDDWNRQIIATSASEGENEGGSKGCGLEWG